MDESNEVRLTSLGSPPCRCYSSDRRYCGTARWLCGTLCTALAFPLVSTERSPTPLVSTEGPLLTPPDATDHDPTTEPSDGTD